MNTNELKILLTAIRSAYPRYNLFIDTNSMKIWYRFLEKYDYQACSDALEQHILTSSYPPSIADIVKNATCSNTKTWSEAWGDVVRSISLYGSSREAEALKSLNKVTRETVKAIGYRDICMSDNPDVVRGQFRSAYEQIQQRQNLNDKLPKELRDRINQRQIKRDGKELSLNDNSNHNQS